MKTRVLIAICAVCLALTPRLSSASEPLHRYLLAIGANDGGPGRVPLKYALSDAERFADVMSRMGGVDPADRIVLREPGPDALESALSDLAARIAKASASGRTEVLVYYSGHADETGLRIGSGRVTYSDLRSKIESIPASVRITVLDACASGAITRLKGGERRQPFLVDVSSEMEGYAFLTSSSANETAQESDAIGASFFTHYLVTGLRGAADVSGDGKVSLTEAYQFAFNETLARTTETMGGAQHPAYDMNLAGTGDVVMTDVRHTSAGLVLEKGLSGRFYVRDRDEHLVAELHKLRGRRIVLGLESGSYTIHLDRDGELLVARVELGLDDLLVLEPGHFRTAERTPSVARGEAGDWPPKPGFMGPLVGRSRIQLIVGKNDKGAGGEAIADGLVTASAETRNLYLGAGYSRWIREDLSVGVAVLVVEGAAQSNVGAEVVNRATGLISLRIGAQKYLPGRLLETPVRPFVSLGVGALMGSEDTNQVVGLQVSNDSSTMGAFGVEFGAGVDFLIARHFMLGSKAAYNMVTDFPEPLAGEKNYSSWEFAVNVSWLFGRGFGG